MKTQAIELYKTHWSDRPSKVVVQANDLEKQYVTVHLSQDSAQILIERINDTIEDFIYESLKKPSN